jgi:hypothetical protein
MAPDDEVKNPGGGTYKVWQNLELTPAQRPVFERIQAMQLQAPVGADSAGVEATNVTPIRPGLVVPKRRIITPTPFVLRPSEDLEPRDWMYGRHLIRKFLSTVFAPGAAGKTSLIFARVLSLVTGRDLLNVGEMDKSKLRAWVVNGEDPMDELERRINAICDKYDISADAIGGRLFVDSGRDANIKIAVQERGSTRIVQPDVDRIIECMQEREIDLLVIDPAVSFHSIPENDNTGIEMFAKEWSRIADYLNSMSEEEANQFGIDVRERGDFFRVEGGKPNMAQRSKRGQTEWYKIESVNLGNAKNGKKSDEVGVVTRYKPTHAADAVTSADLVKIQERLNAAEHGENSQAADWAGKVVAEVTGLDPEADKKKIGVLLKTWIKNRSLKVAEAEDHRNGRMRKIVRAGPIIDFDNLTSSMKRKLDEAPAEPADEPDHDPVTDEVFEPAAAPAAPATQPVGRVPKKVRAALHEHGITDDQIDGMSTVMARGILAAAEKEKAEAEAAALAPKSDIPRQAFTII